MENLFKERKREKKEKRAKRILERIERQKKGLIKVDDIHQSESSPVVIRGESVKELIPIGNILQPLLEAITGKGKIGEGSYPVTQNFSFKQRV